MMRHPSMHAACAWIFAGVLALTVAGACSDSEEQTKNGVQAEVSKAPDPARLLELWNQGSLELDQHRFKEAAATFQRIVDEAPGLADGWVNLGIAALNGVTPELFRVAEEAFRRALAVSPEHLHAHHCLGVLLKHLGQDEDAEKHFRRVLALDPHDPTANYYLATLLIQKEDLEQAEKHLRLSLAAEPHLSSAVHKLFQVMLRLEKEGEREKLLETFRELERTETGDKAGIVYQEMGRYGAGIREFPLALARVPAGPAPILYRRQAILPRGREAPRPTSVVIPSGVAPVTVFTGAFLEAFGFGAALADIDGDGDLDIYVADGVSAGRLFRNDGGSFTDISDEAGLAFAARSISATFGDFDNDGDPDLYVACAGPNLLLRNDGGRFTDITREAGVAGGNAFSAQAVWADFDSDGDLDIYVANLADLDAAPDDQTRSWPATFGGANNALFNNNRDGTFVEIAGRAGTEGGASSTVGVLASDLDGDHDTDLLLIEANGMVRLFRNDRIWRFVDVSANAGLPVLPGAAGALSDDLNGDLKLDLVLIGLAGNQGVLMLNEGRLHFRQATIADALHGSVILYDADNDGSLDILAAGANESSLLRRGRDGQFSPTSGRALGLGDLGGSGSRCLLAADLNGDLVLDLVERRAGQGLDVYFAELESRNHALTVTLTGVREVGKMRANAGGVGAFVEAVAGPIHQVRELKTQAGVLGGSSPQMHFGLGTRTGLDYVRIVWPDDVIQAEPELPAGQSITITEVYRKMSSCPVVFVWDGERFAFVTDMLGTGGLGFFLEPGVYAPPDPTETVILPQLEPKEGHYEVRIHEPLEEVLYLDHVALLVADHDAGLEVVADERMGTAEPFPTGRLIAFHRTERILPRALRTAEGSADVGLVLEADRRFQPGVRPDPRFIGYAAPQTIELDFGTELATASAERPLHLVLDGWVEYPYSRVNFAAWQAGILLEPPSLDVEMEPGTWTVALEGFGYPAGLPRTMTVPLPESVRQGTGKIRLRTNMELYIDRIFIAAEVLDSGLVLHSLRPSKAELRRSGYPREYTPDGREPTLYDYALMDPAFGFRSLAGEYTRFGDVNPLLVREDDQFVILGSGEEIGLAFKALPDPPPGKRRSFALSATGYCKDMDPYTAYPETVEPLPFRTMSGYPYPPSETYPRSLEHHEYRRSWNTRRVPAPR